MKVFITSAAGRIGQSVTSYLAVNTPTGCSIVAGIHSANKQVQQQLLQPFGVETVDFEANNFQSVKESLQGIDKLVIILTAEDNRIHHFENILKAAEENQIKFVLLVSALRSGEESDYWKMFATIERSLQEGSLPWTIIRANYTFQNLKLYEDQLIEGKLPLPIQDGRFAPMDARDIGRVICQIFKNVNPHLAKTYSLTGVDLLGGIQMSEIMSKVLASPVQFQDTSLDVAKDILLKNGLSQMEICGFLNYYEGVRNGSLNLVSSDFQLICQNEKPKTFGEYVQSDMLNLFKKEK